jgi:hypothetical protein
VNGNLYYVYRKNLNRGGAYGTSDVYATHDATGNCIPKLQVDAYTYGSKYAIEAQAQLAW